MSTPKIEVIPIDQGAIPDPSNINKHTVRGHTIVTNSLQKRGAFRSVAAAGKGVEIPVLYAGSDTYTAAVEVGFKEVVRVHTKGDQLVVVVRDDVEPESAEAVALGIEDNESAKQSYNPDVDVLAAVAMGDNAVLAALRKGDKILNNVLEGMEYRLVHFDGNNLPNYPEYETPDVGLRIIIEYDNEEQEAALLKHLGLKKQNKIRYSFSETILNA